MHIRLIFARENRVRLDRFEPATSHSLREICKVRRGFSVDHVPVVRRIRHDGRSLSLRRRRAYVTESKVPLQGIASGFPDNERSKAFPANFRHANEERVADRRRRLAHLRRPTV